MKKHLCKRCGATDLRRINRMGWWQTVVLTYFGYYPWECVMCRRISFHRDNGHQRRSSKASVSSH